MGMINLFIHIVKSPALSTAPSDVALLDVVAGHFGHLEFVSSVEASFGFTRELANIARSLVQKTQKQHPSPGMSEIALHFSRFH